MTKLIGVLIIALVIWGGYELFEMWNRYDTNKDIAAKEAEAAKNFTPDGLSGMPENLRKSYETAKSLGPNGVHDWLRAWHDKVQDPRLAWIELDYAVSIAQKDPVEAKKIYENVKARTPENSPVYPRVKQLEKTYE
jgi:hypothetical protein